MATLKQKLAVGKLVENGGNVSRSMLDAGYTPATASTPQKLTNSKGFQELIEKYLPDDKILGALGEDIDRKPQNRTPELTLAAKIKGMMIEKKDITSGGEKLRGNTIIFQDFSDEPKSK